MNFYAILDYVIERVDFENKVESKNLKGEITNINKLGHGPEFRIATILDSIKWNNYPPSPPKQ